MCILCAYYGSTAKAGGDKPGWMAKEKIGKNQYICSRNFSFKNMMEAVIKEIQSKVNECIQYELATLRESLFLKLQYLDAEQRKSFLHQELFRVTDMLVLLRKNKAIDSLFEYTDYPDFLWDSTFGTVHLLNVLFPMKRKSTKNLICLHSI
jgi:hypothetical protein